MKRYWIGVDGGGTKTAFGIAGNDGVLCAQTETIGTSYRQYSIPVVAERLQQGIAECLCTVQTKMEQVAGICLGLPCYGESRSQDRLLHTVLGKTFYGIPFYLCNDVEVGWAGSLECQSGINIVAGTGAIAFGCNDDGKTARCGGWTEFFGDEGSCYWVGRRGMELFSKQADGRLPKSALYTIVTQTLALEEDFAFIAAVEKDYMPYREKTASFQRLVERAALAGDSSCTRLYEQAAEELALNVTALRQQLGFGAKTVVSYSGGLFRTGNLIMQPFRRLLEAEGCTLQPPKGTPVQGAVWLAQEKFQ